MQYAFSLAWKTLTELYSKFFAALPLIIAGLIVFSVFVLLARLIERAVVAVGSRTRMDATLAKVLAGMASVATTIIGALVASVIIFPDFSLGNLIAGLGSLHG